jgi:excinuclease ABC subunit A
MPEPKPSPAIRLRGVRHNNLKNFDLDLPLRRLIVITGLSGSGKSSLAFDTLYAEGQRRYIETFSPYARQFFDRMDKPQVDSIEGIPPAIAIEQRNAVRTTRSTVGTMTEICDHLKVLWPHLAQLHCRQCAQPVRKDSPQNIWQQLSAEHGTRNGECLVTFDIPLSEKLPLDESLALISKQGYQRILMDGEVIRLDETSSRITRHAARITVIQDRVKLAPAARARFVEACEQAYHFGKGKLAIHLPNSREKAKHASTLQRFNGSMLRFSNHLHCAQCDLEYPEPSPALFSFNHPLGACPACKGFGRVITIDYTLAIPDHSLTLAQGAVKPWRTGTGAESQADMAKFCKRRGVPMDVPFAELSHAHRRWVIDGDDDYGMDDDHRWPRLWYGVKGYFKWLETKSYKMHVRVLLSRYRAYTKCPECDGQRFNRNSQWYLLRMEDRGLTMAKAANAASPCPPLTLADFYALPVRDALALIELIGESRVARHASRNDPISHALSEVRARLAYLDEVGLGYLTLDRPTRTLSGGETERVNLTTCLGTRLVNTLFVLDEPSVGLHSRDTDRLVRILEKLRDTGNTVVVVEHEASVMRAADEIVDLGPGHGATGGHVVFQGPFREILKSAASLTGQYLSGRQRIEMPIRRRVGGGSRLSPFSREKEVSDRGDACPTLRIENATRHNLNNLSVEIPLNRFVAVTGVSGSGKSTLVRDVLFPALSNRLRARPESVKASDRIQDEDENNNEGVKGGSRNTHHASRVTGFETLGQVVLVDQSILGKTPRSNPAVYIGAFDDIRELFAQSEPARRLGFNASAFSFNSSQGQCERCRGAGFEKIEMQFLSDIFIRCPECNGRRYRQHILEVKVRSTLRTPRSALEWSIADLLEATVDEAIDFLAGFTASRAAQRAEAGLKLLQEVGLGYLRLGQPINTLSGGESQRLKLVRHLAEASVENREPKVEGKDPARLSGSGPSTFAPRSTLFLFDEPTTGLHFDDVRVLLRVFQRLVDAGHSVIVIEHNLDVIKCADWVIDLGPEAGDGGGQIVAQGTPAQIAGCAPSRTGNALNRAGLLERSLPGPKPAQRATATVCRARMSVNNLSATST